MDTIKKGDHLELAIYGLLKAEIDAGRFLAKKKRCRLHHRKGYKSLDRGSKIIFDVSIEVFEPGANEYSLLFLYECKNYKHRVPVDDVEEFFAKIQQVGAAGTKGVVVAANGFQSGALAFAKSKRMGLARYFPDEALKWVLHREVSPIAIPASQAAWVAGAMCNPAYQSSAFRLLMQSPHGATASLQRLHENLLDEVGGAPVDHPTLMAPSSPPENRVPFLSHDELERRAMEALYVVGYESGRVDLESLCRLHPLAHGLVVKRLHAQDPDMARMLGRISFDPLVIELMTSEAGNLGRERFTLAHELAHLLLEHGRYLAREESCEDDYTLSPQVTGSPELARLEYQANYFASCLLMPKASFFADVALSLAALDIRMKPFGALYVDAQDCNIDNFMALTHRLMRTYGASRSAVSIRLEGLGLLRDLRSERGGRSMAAVGEL